MDALFWESRKKIIGAASNGERKMRRRPLGVMTWVQQVTNAGLMYVGFDTHQLELCMQAFSLAIPDLVYSTSISLLPYMLRQQNMISEERSQRSLIGLTCWLNMIKVTTLFDKPRLAIAA